jgi:hypothetical protein
MTDGTASGTADGTANRTADGTANRMTDGTANRMTDGTANGTDNRVTSGMVAAATGDYGPGIERKARSRRPWCGMRSPLSLAGTVDRRQAGAGEDLQ